MLSLYFSVNLVTLLLLVVAAGLVGFCFRSHQIKKKQFKISELRKEMVYNHAQILELQKECIGLEAMLRAVKTPVVPMVPSIKDHMSENRELSIISGRHIAQIKPFNRH